MRLFPLTLALLLSCTAAQAQIAAAPQPAVETAIDVPKGILGNAVQPLSYRLDLTVDPSRERFSGKVEVGAVLERSSHSVILHGRDLAMHSAKAVIGGKSYAGMWREVDPTGVAELRFTQPLPAGPVTFAFDYDAPFYDGPSGMFRVNVGGDWYSWTQFESIDARAAFPSFDQPSFKTPFTVTLRTPPGLTAVSNTPEISKTLESGLEIHRFAPTLPLPTYLVAMMVGPFATLEGAVPPTPQRARPLPLRIVSTRQNADRLSFALQGSKEIVALLEDYFADAFPYPKLDQITSPIMPGAMENAGADLYNDSLIVLGENAPVRQQRRFGMVVSHELAHQWFGDLVTPRWWDDIWLNESFANWMGYRIGDAWKPRLNIRAGALAEGFAAMDTDALVAGRPIRQKIDTNAQIDSAFDGITYGKGGHVVAMIAAFMGDAKFRDGVHRYMAAHRYGNAASTDFFAAMAEAAGDPRIVPAMRSFTDQQGVPLLTFTRKGNRYTVTQSRYAYFGTASPDTRWGVPMCVRHAQEKQCTLLTEQSASFSFAGAGPLVPNAGGTGYYRFELPRRDWDALIEQADSLQGGEAQALADSLSASVLAGRSSVRQLAALARKLVHHADSYASDAATAALADLASAGLIAEKGERGWSRFRGTLHGPLLAGYGFDPRAGAYAGEDPEKTQRRAQIVERLMDSTRDKSLREQLLKAAGSYLDGDPAALDPVWFGPAFEAHLRQGGMTAAKALVGKALASEDPLFRPAALNAASATGNEEIARWLLDELNDTRLRPSEKHGLLTGIILTGETRDFGYAWLHDHLEELTSGSGGIFFSSRLPRLLGRFCSVERADTFASELRPRFAGKTGELELERVIERIRNCGRLREARGSEISREFARLK